MVAMTGATFLGVAAFIAIAWAAAEVLHVEGRVLAKLRSRGQTAFGRWRTLARRIAASCLSLSLVLALIFALMGR